MRIFVTGAAGYIGSAVVRALRKAGHEVAGLVRKDAEEQWLRSVGAVPIRGNLRDDSTYQHFVAECDGAIHCAYDPHGGAAFDQTAIETILGALAAEGEPRSMVYTSSPWVLGNTGNTPADESAPYDEAAVVAWRPSHEERVLESENRYLATAVVRPGYVFGGHGGMLQGFFDSALKTGAAVHVGDGRNRWPLVHRDDLAELYRMIVEQQARGVFHGVDGAAPTVGQIARACSEVAGKGGAVRELALDEARRQMGALADALVLDQVLVANRSAEIGWSPKRPRFPQSAKLAWEERNARE